MQQCTHRRFSGRLSNVSHHTKQFIVLALRAAKALAVSLVAEMDGRVIGHLLRPVFRWALSAGHRRFPPRIQGGWPSTPDMIRRRE